MSRYVLLRLYVRGEATRNALIWKQPRWKEYYLRNKGDMTEAEMNAKYLIKTGTKRECEELRKAFDKLMED